MKIKLTIIFQDSGGPLSISNTITSARQFGAVPFPQLPLRRLNHAMRRTERFLEKNDLPTAFLVQNMRSTKSPFKVLHFVGKKEVVMGEREASSMQVHKDLPLILRGVSYFVFLGQSKRHRKIQRRPPGKRPRSSSKSPAP